MQKILGALYLLLCAAGLAYAQNAPEPPPVTEPSSMVGMVIFFVLFFGMIAGFFFWVWYRHRKGLDR